MTSISPICKKCKTFILALKSPTYRDFMIKKSLKSKTSKSHTWAPVISSKIFVLYTYVLAIHICSTALCQTHKEPRAANIKKIVLPWHTLNSEGMPGGGGGGYAHFCYCEVTALLDEVDARSEAKNCWRKFLLGWTKKNIPVTEL